MSTVESLVGSVRDALARTGRSLLVRDAEFGSTLTIGQVIEGRVLRHYEGGRYQVELGGQPRVVDSTTALRLGELVTARVVSVGEQVHLQRLQAGGEGAGEAAASTRAAPTGGGRDAQLAALLAQHRVDLAPLDLAALQRAVRRAGNADLMGLAGVVLSKLGAALRPELLQALYRRLDAAPPALGIVDAPRVSVHPAGRAATSALARDGLATELARQADRGGAGDGVDGEGSLGFGADSDAGARGDGGDPRWALGEWLLNVQSHGRIAHRVVRLPLWVGDRLVEIDVAFFSEARDGSETGGIAFRRAVVALDLERLGRVQVTLAGADRDLRVAVVGERDTAVASLSRFAPALESDLEALDWNVAEMSYARARVGAGGEVLGAVVEHHVTQGSLSRWM